MDRIDDVQTALPVVLLAAIVASAQTPTPSKPAVETAHVTIATSVSAQKAEPGGKLSLFVEIAPKPKMHLYAPGEKEGIPVSLTIESNPAIKAGKPEFPPPQKFYFEPLKLTQLVFSKPFRIAQPIAIVGSPSGAALTIKGVLRYQACDDAVCYLPKNVPLTWTVDR